MSYESPKVHQHNTSCNEITTKLTDNIQSPNSAKPRYKHEHFTKVN